MKPKGKHYVTIERSNASYRRRKKALAQSRLNRAAVAWLSRGQGKRQNIMHRIIELERAVRAFQKLNESQTKGNK